MRKMNQVTLLALLAILLTAAPALRAQFLGAPAHDEFTDTSILHPPAGVKIAIVVFEDLGCPGCAYAHPIEQQVAEKYHVPLLRHDYPIPAHVWTFEAAVYARYLQDAANSQKLAEEFRSDVFHSQTAISSKDDLHHFVQQWFQKHGQKLPASIDPTGALAAKVQADFDLGKRLNLTHTPTVVVITNSNYQVVCGSDSATDPRQLDAVVHAALSQLNPAPAPRSKQTKAK